MFFWQADSKFQNGRGIRSKKLSDFSALDGDGLQVTMSSAQQERITEDEQRKYWEIFTALNPVNGYLTGFQAKTVLENSRLDNAQLEAIWDLADVDNGTQTSSILH